MILYYMIYGIYFLFLLLIEHAPLHQK